VTTSSTLTFTTFGEQRKQTLNGRSSAEFGLRFGHWLDELPWLGFAFDVSYFRPATDVQTVPLSLLVMARYGFLPDEEFKEGRLHVYAGLGGGIFISNVDGFIGRLQSSDTSVDFGLDTRLGVSYRIESEWAIFAEYRFTHASPSYNDNAFDLKTSADATFNTSHFLLGVSYRF